MTSSSEPREDSHPPLGSSTIGSEGWIGSDVYKDGSEWNLESRKFFETFNWNVLASIASSLRGGTSCGYTEKYSMGHFNMVRRLDFDDGVSWVARVRLPPEASPAELSRYDSRRAFDVEIASMKFLKQVSSFTAWGFQNILTVFRSRSTIPVPGVFAYDSEDSNEAGAPYMLLEYIHGTTAEQLGAVSGSEPWSFGTIDQDRKFRDQMAKIQAEVASFTFPSIGSLYLSKETNEFFIGPDLYTGKGPWSSSLDYYRDLADHLLKITITRGSCMTTDSPSFALPVVYNHILGSHSEEIAGPFRLVNNDFGPHNILVDNDFNVVGIVDLDRIMAAPLEAVARYPRFSCMTVFPPGFVEAHPPMVPPIEIRTHLLAGYKEYLTMHESRQGGLAVVAPRLGSTAAIAYAGLLVYADLFWSRNEKWFASALVMLKDYAKALG